MLPDPHPVFFPPWYFWVFAFGAIVVVVGGLVTLIVCVKRAQCQQRIRERELATELMERMVERDLAPVEIERLLDCYWRMGSAWSRFRQLWTRFRPDARGNVPPKQLAEHQQL